MIDLSLYLVTDAAQAARQGHTILETVGAAVSGGVTAVQVREKGAPARETLRMIEALSQRLPERVAIIVNDRVDIHQAAQRRGARVTGVHIGQLDLPADDVRALIGEEAVLGLSVRTPGELSIAESSDARIDYIGIGTVRATTSKTDPPPAIGVEGVIHLARQSQLPAVAIGGVRCGDLPALRRGGLAGVAVVSQICASAQPRCAARELADTWRDAG